MNPSVRLLAWTPNPVRVMALSARLCYTQGCTIAQVDKNLSDAQCEALLGKVLASRHMSVLEHAVFTFGVEGVSRNFSHQMVRHRNTSYSQQSLHYTMAGDDLEVAMPAGLTDSQKARWHEVKAIAFMTYKDLVAEGVQKEEARHLLPSGVETKLVMTGNLRQWLHFTELRTCQVNCREILVVAMKVKRLLEEAVPAVKQLLGPTCWTDGFCREGKKFCEAPWRDTCMVSGMGVAEPYIWGRARKKACGGACSITDARCDGDCSGAVVGKEQETRHGPC